MTWLNYFTAFVFLSVLCFLIKPIVKRIDEQEYFNRRKLETNGFIKRNYFKEWLNKITKKFIPSSRTKQTIINLKQAGMENTNPEYVYILKILLAVILGLIGTVVSGENKLALILGLCLSALGFKLPDIYINNKKQKYRKNINKDILLFTELLYTAVEAGSEIDNAVIKISNKFKCSLSEAFKNTWNSFKTTPRNQAIKNMAIRCGSKDLDMLLDSLQLSHESGIGIAEILKNHAQRMRTNIKNELTEYGEKLELKLLIPMFLFILPALFIVILTPVLIASMDMLNNF